MGKAEFNPLSNKKILVKYKMNFKNGITEKRHPLYGGMLDTATTTLYLKKNPSTGAYVDPFTEDERAFVAATMGIEEVRLSPHALTNNYWDTYRVVLSKTGTILDMKNIEDFVKYKVLLSNTGIISPDFESVKKRETYKYYLVDEANEIKTKSTVINSRKEAYMSYGKIDSDKDKLSYMIWQMTKQFQAKNTSIDVLQAKIMDGDMLESRAEKFNKIFKDKLFEYKIVIYKGLLNSVITRKNEEYYMEGKIIVDNGSTGNLENTAIFLANPANQEIKFLIEDRISNAQ